MKTDWKPARLVDLVNHLHDVVRLQYADMERITFDNLWIEDCNKQQSFAFVHTPRPIHALSHTWHLYGFSPLWILLWSTKWLDLVNCLLQTVHSNSSSPEWLPMWTASVQLLSKRLPHSVASINLSIGGRGEIGEHSPTNWKLGGSVLLQSSSRNEDVFWLGQGAWQAWQQEEEIVPSPQEAIWWWEQQEEIVPSLQKARWWWE